MIAIEAHAVFWPSLDGRSMGDGGEGGSLPSATLMSSTALRFIVWSCVNIVCILVSRVKIQAQLDRREIWRERLTPMIGFTILTLIQMVPLQGFNLRYLSGNRPGME